MTPAAAVLLTCAFLAGLKLIHAVRVWSFSTPRRRHLEAKARAKAARHQAGRWVA